MKRKIWIAASVLAITLTACSGDGKIDADDVKINATASGESDQETEKPKMVFEEERYDFGTINQGEKVSHSFKFKNEGDADLIIASARGSCGCTVPSWPKEPIPPGGEGVIDVVFDSNGKRGKQHKTVTVVANTIPATNVVAITGEVVIPEETQE
jgi:hypothetical protein